MTEEHMRKVEDLIAKLYNERFYIKGEEITFLIQNVRDYLAYVQRKHTSGSL